MAHSPGEKRCMACSAPGPTGATGGSSGVELLVLAAPGADMLAVDMLAAADMFMLPAAGVLTLPVILPVQLVVSLPVGVSVAVASVGFSNRCDLLPQQEWSDAAHPFHIACKRR